VRGFSFIAFTLAKVHWSVGQCTYLVVLSFVVGFIDVGAKRYVRKNTYKLAGLLLLEK
jgi:hypothetical protein